MIFSCGDKGASLFCHESIADYIVENLDRARHTNVVCRRAEGEILLENAEPERISVTVVSPRADGVISKVYNLSREESRELFNNGRVFINGIQTQNLSCQLKAEDAVTVRGFGKFIFTGRRARAGRGKTGWKSGFWETVDKWIKREYTIQKRAGEEHP